VLRILVIAFIFTLFSGIYIFRLSARFLTQVSFGFPFHWLIASRSVLESHGVGPHTIEIYSLGLWHVNFLWSWFFADFAIYGLLVTTAMGIYEKKLEHMSKPKIYGFFFLLSSVVLITCCWVFIFWNSIYSLPSFLVRNSLLQMPYNNYARVESFLRFFIGVMTIVFTWSLIKYLRKVSTP